MTRADDLAQGYSALTPTVQAAVDELTGLYAQVAELVASIDPLAAENNALKSEVTTLEADAAADHAHMAAQDDLILQLNARIGELEAMLPPEFVRVLRPFGPDGGGGMNGITVDSLGGMWMPTDVGGVCHANPGEWFWHKCNTGLGGRRHIASLVEFGAGAMLLHGGAPGGQEGAFLFDPGLHEWTGPRAGSTRGQVNSQNSDGWGLGIGHRYARSTGSLSFIRDNGDLVIGEFGYAPPGAGVCIVKPDGSAKTIPGTEQWAVRDLKALTGGHDALVSVWKGGTKVASPGGLWSVNLFDGSVSGQLLGGEVEESCTLDGTIIAAARNDGIKRATNGNAFEDITYNLPRASWWYTVSFGADGTIYAGCITPQKGPDGKFWSWVRLRPGSTTWENLTTFAPVPFDQKVPPRPAIGSDLDGYLPPNPRNVLGEGGCTIVGVGERDGVPVCAGGGGIAYAFVDGGAKAAHNGAGIVVYRDLDRTADGWTAMAASDFQLLWSKDDIHWARVGGLPGGNDGQAVCWVGHELHYLGPGGERYTFNADSGILRSTTGAMPAKAPQPGNPTQETRDAVDALAEPFGPLSVRYWVDDETMIGANHGAFISKIEEVSGA